jgi:hypothetical protein
MKDELEGSAMKGAWDLTDNRKPVDGSTIMSLDRTSLGIIISRVLGIYVVVTAVQYFPMMSSLFLGPEYNRGLFSIVVVAGFFLHLALGYVLLVHAPRVAAFLVSETSVDPEASDRLDADTIASTAFIIIGVTLLLRGLPTFAEQLTLRLSGVKGGIASDALLVGLAVQALIGIYLILDRKGLINLIRRIRGEGNTY